MLKMIDQKTNYPPHGWAFTPYSFLQQDFTYPTFAKPKFQVSQHDIEKDPLIANWWPWGGSFIYTLHDKSVITWLKLESLWWPKLYVTLVEKCPTLSCLLHQCSSCVTFTLFATSLHLSENTVVGTGFCRIWSFYDRNKPTTLIPSRVRLHHYSAGKWLRYEWKWVGLLLQHTHWKLEKTRIIHYNPGIWELTNLMLHNKVIFA